MTVIYFSWTSIFFLTHQYSEKCISHYDYDTAHNVHGSGFLNDNTFLVAYKLGKNLKKS